MTPDSNQEPDPASDFLAVATDRETRSPPVNPESHERDVAAVREALWVDGQPELVYTSALASANMQALAALDRLAKRVQEAERERDEARGNAESFRSSMYALEERVAALNWPEKDKQIDYLRHFLKEAESERDDCEERSGQLRSSFYKAQARAEAAEAREAAYKKALDARRRSRERQSSP